MYLKYIFKKLPNYIFLFGSLILIQTLTIYNQDQCKSKFGLNKGRHCHILEKIKFDFFGSTIINNFRDLKVLVTTRNRSGMIAKNMANVRERFNDKNAGFNFYFKKGSRPNAGFLLLSAGDPYNNGSPLIELWDINKQKLLYKWDFNIEGLLEKENITTTNRMLHPLLLSDGSLIVTNVGKKNQILKISPSGNLIRTNKEIVFHHSLEVDQQENIYAPIHKELGNPNDGFVILDKELNLLKKVFIEDIYKKAGLEYLYYSPIPFVDPFHLNDVQPFIENSQSRIVLLSLRNKNSIMAYNFQDEKVIWILNGYATMQHDVDILNADGSHISIFDNNTLGKRETKFNIFTTIKNLPSLYEDTNEKLIYNYSSSSKNEKELIIKTEKFNSLKANLVPKTTTQGLAEFIKENDSIFVEETNHGRLMEYDLKTKKLLWEYINRNDLNKNYYMMAWSRRILKLPNGLLNKLPEQNIFKNNEK